MDDLISRQSAIDALRDAENHAFNSFYQGLLKAHKIIADLPSSQTEQRWIPCSERLPEEWRDVLLSFDKSITEWTNVGYMFRDEETFEYWFQSDGMSYKKDDVLAWMPLPDAYEEDD